VSSARDIFEGVQGILSMRGDINRLSTAMQETQAKLREHDNRLVRIETIVEIGQRLLLPQR
jgi:hypothetical protein